MNNTMDASRTVGQSEADNDYDTDGAMIKLHKTNLLKKVIQASAHSMSSRRKDDDSRNSQSNGSRDRNAWCSRRVSGQSCEVKVRPASFHLGGPAYNQDEAETQRPSRRPPRFGNSHNEIHGRFRTRFTALNHSSDQNGTRNQQH